MSAMISLKRVTAYAPDDLRQELQPLSKVALIHRCAVLRPGKVTTIVASTKHTLWSIARRWRVLDTELSEHDKLWQN